MLYAALTFWLFVTIFCALGIHMLWSGMIKPRIVNSILLPGTLVATLGHVLGLLITGNSVQNTKLMGDDEAGAPQSSPPEKARIPVIGPILIGLLPLVACAACLHVAASYLGGGTLANFAQSAAALQNVPMTVNGVWDLPRNGLRLAEVAAKSVASSDRTNWKTLLFLYLTICLTVRMAPFDGNRRGAIGAILLAGIVIGVLGSFVPAARELVLSSWGVLSFAVGTLLLLLMISLLVRGGVGLVMTLVRGE